MLQDFLLENRRLQSWWRLWKAFLVADPYKYKDGPAHWDWQPKEWQKSVWGDFGMQQSPGNYSKPHFCNGP